MRMLLALLLAVAPAVAPPPPWRPAALHAIVSYALNGATQQFRNLKKLPPDAKRVFDYCQVAPREKYGALFEEMRPVFECQDSWLRVFKGRADFVTAMHAVLPAGFTRAAACPKQYDGLVFLACLRRTDDVEVLLAEDASATYPELSSWSFFVVASPLPPNERAKARAEARASLAPLFAALTTTVAHGFGQDQGPRFAARHAALLKGCEVHRPPTGRPVLDCEVRDLWSLTRTDFVAAVHAALPSGFHRSTCVERSAAYAGLSAVCERDTEAIEVHFGEFFHIEADDAGYPVSRTATMRQFLDSAFAVAARKFAGFDPKTELPYFGRCDVRLWSETAQRYLECSPSLEAVEFDLIAVVRDALPPGYAAKACTLNYWPFLRPDEAKWGCFGRASRPEIDVAEYQSEWFVNVGLPNSQR